MCKYDDITHDPIPPILASGEKEHVLVAQDKCIVNVNKGPWHIWLKGDQQPLKKGGTGMQSTFVVGFARLWDT